MKDTLHIFGKSFCALPGMKSLILLLWHLVLRANPTTAFQSPSLAHAVVLSLDRPRRCRSSVAIRHHITSTGGQEERRSFLCICISQCTSLFVAVARARESSAVSALGEPEVGAYAQQPIRRPYAASVEALIPATQVRRLLHDASLLATRLGTENANEANLTLSQLRSLFADDLSVPERSVSRRQPPISRSSTSGLDAWVKLDHLSGPLVRSALNIYTANLRFSDSYVLTADPAVRKQLIRSDALPNVQTVITADLDLRDLYRNAIQTAVDDLQAELFSTGDVMEVHTLLSQAQVAVTAWFALIDEADIRDTERRLQELAAKY
jgi:hypothetical protein